MPNESEERWRGRVDATLQGIHAEFVPLRALPQAMAVMQLQAEREAEERRRLAEERERRDREQDERLERIEVKIDKTASRRNLLLGLVPVFVALITTAGFLLKG